MKKRDKELKDFLDAKVALYNQTQFIGTDPIQVPHRYSVKEDIEIAGLLTSTIAWGQRATIIRNALRLMELMDDSPHQFIVQHQDKDLKKFEGFVHRTFNDSDLLFFLSSLNNIYKNHGGMEMAFTDGVNSAFDAIEQFRSKLLDFPHESRSEKHVSNPAKGSSAKRLNMFLRWMVRKDDAGVDFGIWNSIESSQLSLPLDVHTGNVARKLGILKRKQNDRKAVEEIDEVLRKFDPLDPIKYDFALFGIGAFE